MSIPALKLSAKRLTPLLNRVLVKKDSAPKRTDGGIVLPETAKKMLTGTVVAVGPGHRADNGQLIEINIKPGDNVILPDYGSTKIELEGGETYFIYRESEILAKIEEQS